MLSLDEQAEHARQGGIQEVLALLQNPSDLARLPDLIQEYEAKLAACQTNLGNLLQSQVEAAASGIELLDKSHRHTIKLRACLDSINILCAECRSLIDHQDRIQLLSRTHSNVNKVLSEIKDIIDLPSHAEAALELLDDPANIVDAYKALVVLESTAENAKLAWKRNDKAARMDMSSLMQYLERVSDAAAQFEDLLWGYLQDYETLAHDQPSLLVDCVRCVELQERVDKQYSATKMEAFPGKKWKQRLLDMIAAGIADKFSILVEQAPLCGVPNKVLKYTSDGDVILDENRDYLGALTNVIILDKMSGTTSEVSEPAVLKKLKIIEEEAFDEEVFIDGIVPELYAVEADLAHVYDHVTPCFPPQYEIFDTLFQMYHIQVAMVIDTLGQRADKLSTSGALKIMEFVHKYMDSLRGFGIEEHLVRLPVSPLTDPDLPPGLDMLMNSYIDRMQKNVSKWYQNIIQADLEYEPKAGPTGTLYTSGVTDFFRIMHEEMEVLRAIDNHGEVMFKTAQMALTCMKGFQAEQTRILRDQDTSVSFEMFCAMVNNNVECYEQSLNFAEEVTEQLEEEYQGQVEVEEVCRGFLDVAKEAARRVVGTIFNDPGMSAQIKSLYSTQQEWISGRTTATLIATMEDYMGDIKSFIEPSFVKRVAEAMLEELARRAVNIFIAGIPQVNDVFVNRMQADEDAFMTYFSSYLRPDKMAMPLQQLSDLRLLVSADSVSMSIAAYESALSVHSGFTLDVLGKILDSRGGYGGWDKKQPKEVLAAAKDVWRKHSTAQEAADKAKLPASGKSGFFSSLFG